MNEPETQLIRVTGNTKINGKGILFVAGLKIANERCVEAAPILWWAKGRPAEWLRAEFVRRNLTATVSAYNSSSSTI